CAGRENGTHSASGRAEAAGHRPRGAAPSAVRPEPAPGRHAAALRTAAEHGRPGPAAGLHDSRPRAPAGVGRSVGVTAGIVWGRSPTCHEETQASACATVQRWEFSTHANV